VLTQEARRKGGQAVARKQPPAVCPHCGKSMAGRKWHSYLGHLGLHGLANNHFDGDIEAAQRRLRENALALAEQGASWSNGAWGVYKPITQP
jgi:hypothetical protein